MIQFHKGPDDRVLELGGGESRHALADVMCDVRAGPHVNFVADFRAPLPIADGDFTIVYAAFVLEHLPFTRTLEFLRDVCRVLKPGGHAIFLTPDTEAQRRWIQEHPDGWDGKDAFTASSELLYGSQTYEENAHMAYLSPVIVTYLFRQAGFVAVTVSPYNSRNTDMLIEAVKSTEHPLSAENAPVRVQDATSPPDAESVPVGGDNAAATGSDAVSAVPEANVATEDVPAPNPTAELMRTTEGREAVFGRAYFNGGGTHGGYAREGMSDFPCHNLTALHILSRKPESVFEVGCARGYVLKRVQDQGVRGQGIEISNHCFLTRLCDGIFRHDICRVPWPVGDKEFDLLYDVAVMEHIPENLLPAVIREMRRVSKRGLHGIDFGGRDDGWDKTHTTLRDRAWWESMFSRFAPDWPTEIVDKEELEQGEYPASLFEGDGKNKWNFGSFVTMHHHGWRNVDIHDLRAYAQAYRYNFIPHDLRNGIPSGTGVADLLFSSHFLEHLSYSEGIRFLRECRRVIRRDGAMRIIVPDAALLMRRYVQGDVGKSPLEAMSEWDELNEGSANSLTAASKLWALLHEGHHAAYDYETLADALHQAGWESRPASFRQTSVPQCEQILRETLDMLPSVSLYVDAVPVVG